MASVLPTPSDCCNTCVCNVIEVDICPTPPAGITDLTVDNTAALRLVLAAQRAEGMLVRVLSDTGSPFDGTGYLTIWRGADLSPDNPVLVVRPSDVASDAAPGRFRQLL